MRMWRNWQTREVQDLVAARSWRFKSSHPHQIQLPVASQDLLTRPGTNTSYGETMRSDEKVWTAGSLLDWQLATGSMRLRIVCACCGFARFRTGGFYRAEL